jgi:hypothetical protein
MNLLSSVCNKKIRSRSEAKRYHPYLRVYQPLVEPWHHCRPILDGQIGNPFLGEFSPWKLLKIGKIDFFI